MNQAEDRVREKVIGAAMAVHRALGPGFLESVYQRALAVELRRSGLAFEEQAALTVHYKGEIVGDFVADFVVERTLIVEIKAVSTLLPAHEVQTVNYLNATGLESGLLINFGAGSLEFHRKFRKSRNPVNPVNPVSAFTILELLVAMAVMALLLVVLMNMVDGATKLWRESENRVDAYREARAALGVISQDLQNLVAHSTNTNFFLSNQQAFVPLSAVGTAVTSTNNAAALFFLTALPAKAQDQTNARSDVCQVGYFLALDRATTGGARSLNLYRYFRSSDPTFRTLTNNISALFRDPLPQLPSDETELLARNVVAFSTRAFTQTNNTLVPFISSTNTPVPDLIELSVSAINQDAARKLPTTTSGWTNTDTAIMRPAVQTFTTRIRLNRPPPN